MPVTQRAAMMRLTPISSDPTRSGSRLGEYLKSLQPLWLALQTGLAVFAVIVIARYCLRRIFKRNFFASVPSQLRSNPGSTRSHFSRSLREQQQRLHGKWAMDEKLDDTTAGLDRNMEGQHLNFGTNGQDSDTLSGFAPNVADYPFIMSRPPPAPPLTPPELSSVVFHIKGQMSHTDASFIHQPNPDYMSSSTTTSTESHSSSTPSPSTRRRSYHKTVPIGIPISRQSSASEADLTFPPNSYPSTNPLLPPAPDSIFGYDEEASTDELPEKAIDVQGEIVSVLDKAGAGWTRHTRVYGGGVCLACAAAGREHGSGGFYGANVSPDEMR